LKLGINEYRFSSLIKISFLGGLTALASLLLYQSTVSRYPVQARNITMVNEFAYIVLALVFAGVCVSLGALTRYFMRSSLKNGTTKLPLTIIVLSQALNDKHSFRAFVLACLMYGLFFAFVSSLLVYQPTGHFSETYGVLVPSVLPVVCCGSLGQMPQLVVYLTQEFAILVIPANLILLLAVSWLVGLNVAIATYSYKNRSRNHRNSWFSGLGACVGLFTACPTCAGFFFMTILGLAGAVTFALTLSSLQIVFLGLGLPMLLLTPITTARKYRQGQTAYCTVSSYKVKDNHQERNAT